MTEKQILIGSLSALGAMVIAGIGIADYRLEKYEVMAENAAKEAEIETVYHISSSIGTKEDFFKELNSLISWEEKNRAAIDTAFEYDVSKHGFSNRYENNSILLGIDSAEEIKEHMRIQQNIKLSEELTEGTYSAIEDIFEENESIFDTSRETVSSCYYDGGFEQINLMMEQLENGQGMDAYNTVVEINKGALVEYCFSDCEWGELALDIGFYTYPQLLIDVCEENLNKVLKSNELNIMEIPVSMAELLSSRYGVKFENLEQASKTVEYLEYLEMPEIPEVGMSIERAQKTKLGKTPFVTTKHSSWGDKKHTYGEMRWYIGSKMIFEAKYYDGIIDRVTDMRNYKNSRPHYTPYSGYSSQAEIDPDDYDIDGYYEDYKDLYDSYEDAYDGFLDDESVWDDYD